MGVAWKCTTFGTNQNCPVSLGRDTRRKIPTPGELSPYGRPAEQWSIRKPAIPLVVARARRRSLRVGDGIHAVGPLELPRRTDRRAVLGSRSLHRDTHAPGDPYLLVNGAGG